MLCTMLTLLVLCGAYFCAAEHPTQDGKTVYPEFIFDGSSSSETDFSKFQFPPHFKFGVATSAYQVEGAWNVSGKGESIWDYQVHHHPERIVNGATGDIACDSYHNIDVDIGLLKQLKVNFFRFSLSWTRLLPYGYVNESSADGVRYYNELIDKLLENKIIPLVTLYHWDLPQRFQELGGWTNELVVGYMVDYARFCFKTFGDRVKHWITFNEPTLITQFGYGSGAMAPFISQEGIAPYIAARNLLLAHGKIYHVYKREFHQQRGKIGITIETSWFEPLTKSKEDKEVSERVMQMYFGWFAHPIFSSKGGYPDVMIKRIDELSAEEGFRESRLPPFTNTEIANIRGTSDFLGLNHYTTFYVTDGEIDNAMFTKDMHVVSSVDPSWGKTARSFFYVVPWGLRKLLNWVKRQYGDVPVLITENGYAGFQTDTVDDDNGPKYFKAYLNDTLKAIIDDKCNVQAYTAWSFMDNFEWTSGYTIRFGLYYVDFQDPNRTRTPKKSAFTFQDIIVTRKIDETLIPDKFLH